AGDDRAPAGVAAVGGAEAGEQRRAHRAAHPVGADDQVGGERPVAGRHHRGGAAGIPGADAGAPGPGHHLHARGARAVQQRGVQPAAVYADQSGRPPGPGVVGETEHRAPVHVQGAARPGRGAQGGDGRVVEPQAAQGGRGVAGQRDARPHLARLAGPLQDGGAPALPGQRGGRCQAGDPAADHRRRQLPHGFSDLPLGGRPGGRPLVHYDGSGIRYGGSERGAGTYTRPMPPPNPHRRRALADAAVSLLADRGAHGLTHRSVEALAEVPAGTASNYFRSREALLIAAAERIVELHLADMEAATATEREPSGRPRWAEDAEAFADLLADSLWTAATVLRERYLAVF